MVKVQRYCCGYDDGIDVFQSWEEADSFRETWVGSGGQFEGDHVRQAIIIEVTEA